MQFNGMLAESGVDVTGVSRAFLRVALLPNNLQQ